MTTTPAIWTAMESNNSVTENGATTHSTSSNSLTDLFFKVGGMRAATEEDIVDTFIKAYCEFPHEAMKCLFYARDIRGGQGERRFFKTCIASLGKYWGSSNHLEKNLHLIPEYGRWSDLEALVGTTLQGKAIALWANAILNKDALACKWAPREKSSKRRIATLLRDYLGMNPKQYRKHLAAHSKVVESQMCAQEWSEINFSHVPSRAMSIYRKAFQRNSEDTFNEWTESLVKGEAKVNSGTLYPYEIVRSAQEGFNATVEQQALLSAMWESLPDYFEGSERSVLPVIDVSGSMMSPINGGTTYGVGPTCRDVAIGLGMYCSERTNGPFKNKFITFSEKPELVNLPKIDLLDRIASISTSSWGMTTDFQAVFDLILNAAKRQGLAQSDLPEIILVISDMEFNEAEGGFNGHWGGRKSKTNFDAAKQKFEKAGYTLPQLVFWNVQSRSSDNVPVKFDENGTALVSGFSPSIMKSILASEQLTPMNIVLKALNSERYSQIQ